MTLPNFFIIGAGRSGTTSMHQYLNQHPDVFMSRVKEPRFFGQREYRAGLDPKRRWLRLKTAIHDRDRYVALFDGVRGERAIGESSVSYICNHSATREIRAEIPHARLIAVLRNPVDRAWASFVGVTREGAERDPDMWSATEEDARRRGVPVAQTRYLHSGFFFAHLSAYRASFPAEQLLTIFFEDFRRDPPATMRAIFTFLDVDPSFAVDTGTRHNASGIIRNPLLRRLWVHSRPARELAGPHFPQSVRDAVGRVALRNLERPPMPPALRAKLIDLYRDDIIALQGLVGRDLSHWLEAEA